MNKTPYDNGMDNGLVLGREEGIERGIEQGIEQGIEVGKEKAMRSAVIALLESKYRTVPKQYLERIGTLGYDDLLTLVVIIPNSTSMESLFPAS